MYLGWCSPHEDRKKGGKPYFLQPKSSHPGALRLPIFHGTVLALSLKFLIASVLYVFTHLAFSTLWFQISNAFFGITTILQTLVSCNF